MARAYQYITSKTSPNQNARNSKITGLTIHWWGTPSGQSPEGVVSWLCDKRAGTSAHYVVSEGTVWCLVDPERRAWHAGNSKANHTQIGIELDPNQSRRAATEKTAAALIADLRAVYGNLPLYPHRHWTSTQCPGNWDLGRLDRLARGVKPGVPIGGGASAPAASKPASKPAQKPAAVKAPAFPLPRRRGAMFYYGPSSGPKTSVSGMGRNTAVPGDVVQVKGRWRSKGLAQFQARLIKRGWSELARAGGADGRFGATTEKVVGQFQKSMGLPVDYRVGPGTWAAAWTEPVT